MRTRVLRAALPPLLACTFGLQSAHADLYTWVDASGGVNVSNLAPPAGVRVTNLTASTPRTTNDYAREATRDAEVQALKERVGQLEDVIGAQGSSSSYWYYCRDPAGFYPDVQTCSSEWLRMQMLIFGAKP